MNIIGKALQRDAAHLLDHVHLTRIALDFADAGKRHHQREESRPPFDIDIS
jgi:hypothetical protein